MKLKFAFIFLLFFISLYGNSIDKFNYFIDETSNLTINEVVEKNFDKTSKNGFVLGNIKGNLWIELPIKNIDATNFILSINEGFYERFNLYIKEDNIWKKYQNSIYNSLEKREISSNILQIPFEISQKNPIIYIELYTRFNYFGELKLYDIKEYLYFKGLNFNNFLPFFFGILFIIILLNLFVFGVFREKIYIYYTLYTFSSMMFYSINTGSIVYLGLEKYTFDLYFFTVLIMVFLLLFTKELFDLENEFKILNKLLNISLVWFLFLSIAIFFSYRPWNNIFNISLILMNILFLIMAIYVYKKSFEESIIYLIGIVVYLFGTTILALMAMGYLEYSFFSRHALFYGSLSEILLFQFLLVKRHQRIKITNEKIQQEIFDLQNQKKEELKKEVEKQTKEIKEYALEKEFLLKEVHHRVKNNFHTLIGMLWLNDNKNGTEHNKKLINQLQAISSIHEKLYAKDNVSHIEIKPYLKELIDNNIISSNLDIDVDEDIKDISLDFEDTTSIGIIANELITNAIKHNSDKERLKIDIKLYELDNKTILEFSDDGRGIDKINEDGFGMMLIKQYVSEMRNSKYHFKNADSKNRGCNFYLEFEVKKEEKSK